MIAASFQSLNPWGQLSGEQSDLPNENAQNVIVLRSGLYAANVGSLPVSGETPNLNSKEYAMADVTRDEIDAKLEASEARADTKLARLEGKLDLVVETVRSSRDEARDNRRAIIANLWVIFGVLVAIVGILFTVLPTVLDLGFKWRETISKEVETQVQKAPSHQQ
jgi:hypothetical protein